MSDGFTQFGRYLLIDPLSSGGMGRVHLALGPDGEPCVVKRLHDESAHDPERQRRFAREAALSRRLVHSNLVRHLDDGHVEGIPYLVQEYVRGADLALFLSRLGTQGLTLPISAAAHIVSLLCRGLHYLHGVEDGAFIHRDVSPSNIQLALDGNVKLLDFGLAKSAWDCELTTPGSTLGKLAYMAPEHLRGEPLDRRTDVYAAGAVFWELLTGGRLLADHIEGSADDTVRRLCEGQAPPPSRFNAEVPPDLDKLVIHALARKREDRLPDARALAAGAARFSQGGRDALVHLLRTLFQSDAAEARYAERLQQARACLYRHRSRSRGLAGRTQLARGAWLLLGTAAGLVVGASAILTTRHLVSNRTNPTGSVHLHSLEASGGEPAPSAPVTGNEDTTATEKGTPPSAELSASPSALFALAKTQADEDTTRAAFAALPGRASKKNRNAPAVTTDSSAVTLASPEEPPRVGSGANQAEAPARESPQRPDEGGSTLKAARAAFDRGEFAEAARLAEHAIDAGANGHPLLGAALFKLGRLRESEAAFTEALARDPQNARLLYQLGQIRKLARAQAADKGQP